MVSTSATQPTFPEDLRETTDEYTIRFLYYDTLFYTTNSTMNFFVSDNDYQNPKKEVNNKLNHNNIKGKRLHKGDKVDKPFYSMYDHNKQKY